MKFSVLALLSTPILVSAQYGYDSGSSSAAPAAASSAAPAAASSAAAPSLGPGEHLVQVGAGSLTFAPSSLDVKANDTIVFFFKQAQGIMHTVTQSSFAAPCTALQGGFDSGPVSTGDVFKLTVKDDSKTIWFYCQVTQPAKHCGKGMVGAINVSRGNKTIDAFVSAAQAIGDNEPAQTFSTGLSGIGAAATAPAASPAPAASSAPATPSKPSGAGQLTVNAGWLVATFFAILVFA